MSRATPTVVPSVPARRGRLPWGTVLALGDQVAVSGTNFFATLVLGRWASPDQLGLYTLAFTLLVLLVCAFESLVTIPFTVYANRVDADGRRILAGSVLVHHLVLTGAAVAFLAAAAGLLALAGEADLAAVVIVLAGLAPGMLLRELARRFSFADHDALSAFVLDAGVSVLQVGLLLSLLSQGRLTAISAHLAAGAAAAVAGIAWLLPGWRRFAFVAAQVRADAARHWSFGRWVLAGQALGVIHGYAVHWLLLLWSDSTATGVYAACLTVVLLANPFLFGMGNVLGPRAARAYAEHGKAGVRQVVRQGMALFAAVMSVFCGGVLLLAGPTLSLFYGPRYAGEEHVVRLLAGSVFVFSLGLAMDHGLRALEQPHLSFRVSVVSLSVTVAAACLLIPAYGVLGAAAGYLLGSCVSVLGRYLYLVRLERSPTTAEGTA